MSEDKLYDEVEKNYLEGLELYQECTRNIIDESNEIIRHVDSMCEIFGKRKEYEKEALKLLGKQFEITRKRIIEAKKQLN